MQLRGAGRSGGAHARTAPGGLTGDGRAGEGTLDRRRFPPSSRAALPCRDEGVGQCNAPVHSHRKRHLQSPEEAGMLIEPGGSRARRSHARGADENG